VSDTRDAQAAFAPCGRRGHPLWNHSILRGTHHDSDDGPVDQRTQPVRFWLHVIGVYLLGLLTITIGFQTKTGAFLISLVNKIAK